MTQEELRGLTKVLRPQGELWLGLSRIRISKDAVSRIAQRLEGELSAWRERLLELAYPYLTWTPATSR